MVQRIEDAGEKERIASEILSALPEWFGIPESRQEYIRESREQVFWADMEDGRARGFLSAKGTSPHALELYVMGVLPQYHRQGIGRALFAAFYQYAGESGYSLLQVKTVCEGRYREYDRTVAFYRGMGFRELECFPTLWDAWNPCQILVMPVQ